MAVICACKNMLQECWCVLDHLDFPHIQSTLCIQYTIHKTKTHSPNDKKNKTKQNIERQHTFTPFITNKLNLATSISGQLKQSYVKYNIGTNPKITVSVKL